MLDKYRAKRDFSRSPEPPPHPPVGRGGPLSFVVHKHAARRLHYDLRLEMEGVLKSWAVPAGPSPDPATKRLAVMVEDHPLDYASFEGTIPEGEYGAGQVIVWDRGSYWPQDESGHSVGGRENAETAMRRGLAKGKLSLELNGQKMKGSWALVRMRVAGKKENWLLIKHHDEFAGPAGELLARGESVLSALTVDDLKAGRVPLTRARENPAALPAGARQAPFPEHIAPMLATLTERPFSDPDWLYEPKLDGFRMIAFIRQGSVKMQSRRGLDDTNRFPGIADSLAKQEASQLILDGEVVALDEQKRPCFQCLQQQLRLEVGSHEHARPPITYYVFDVLYVDGFDLTSARLDERIAVLKRLLRQSEVVRTIEAFLQAGEVVYEAAVRQGFEGVVAKRRDSVYEPGVRSKNWLKVKAVFADEFVIGGYSQGQGARAHTLGALLLGQYDDNGRLIYVGHAGSGFDERSLVELRRSLDALRVDEPPFAAPPPLNALTTWVRPELVAEVKFQQRTQEGLLRMPVFMRLREDKPAGDVRRTQVAPAPGGRSDLRGGPNPGTGVARQVLDQLVQNKTDEFVIEVQRNRISVSNLGKPLWPASGERRALTKRDFLFYLASVSPFMLPHLKDRPLTLTRYPDGIYGERFYQKHYDAALPPFVETVPIFSEHNGGVQDYLVCNNLATLIWLGQLADVEIHTWFSRTVPGPDGPDPGWLVPGNAGLADRIVDYPDFIIFDLDPYIYSGKEKKGEEPELNRAAYAGTAQAAGWLKEILDGLSLPAFVKTSGKTGLHVYVPILRQFGYKAVRSAAETIGRFLLDKHPQDITMEWAVDKRAGKIFLDHNRNARGQTLASVYSARPTPEAAVSVPLRWDELRHVYPSDFTILTVPERLGRLGDVWAGILESKGDLKGLLGNATTGGWLLPPAARPSTP